LLQCALVFRPAQRPVQQKSFGLAQPRRAGRQTALGGPSSRFTALLESLTIAWLKAASQKAVAEQLGLSWDEIHGIMERAVKRGRLARRQAEPIRHLGVDEKAYARGTNT
jgi:hypothetical protein